MDVLLNRSEKWNKNGSTKYLVVVSDVPFENAVPSELQKNFVSLEFDLPDKEELEKIYDETVGLFKDNPKFKNPDKEEKSNIVDSLKGLTATEAENAITFSVIRDEGKLNSQTVAELQAKEIESTAGLKLGSYTDSFDDLKGYY